MMPAKEASSTPATAGSPRTGVVLRRAPERLGSDSARTGNRLESEIAEEGARRIGTMAILTALTVVGVAILQHVLQPELAAAHHSPVFRLSALFLVLASTGLAALERSNALSAQMLLDC